MAVGDKLWYEGFSHFVPGMDKGMLWVIKPSKGDRPQTGKEHVTHKGVILKMKCHALSKVADMSIESILPSYIT